MPTQRVNEGEDFIVEFKSREFDSAPAVNVLKVSGTTGAVEVVGTLSIDGVEISPSDAALAESLASHVAGQGAALVGMQGSGTVQTAVTTAQSTADQAILDAAAALAAAGPQMTAANLTDADVTITVSQGTNRTLPAATLTANRSVTVDPTGMETDEIIQITRLDVTNKTLAIINGGPGAGTVYTFAASLKRTINLRFDGTNIVLAGIARIV